MKSITVSTASEKAPVGLETCVQVSTLQDDRHAFIAVVDCLLQGSGAMEVWDAVNAALYGDGPNREFVVVEDFIPGLAYRVTIAGEALRCLPRWNRRAFLEGCLRHRLVGPGWVGKEEESA